VEPELDGADAAGLEDDDAADGLEEDDVGDGLEDEDVRAEDVDSRRDWRAITVATARNSVTANVTTHLRIVRRRRRRAASRWLADDGASERGSRGVVRGARGSGKAEGLAGVIVTSVKLCCVHRVGASCQRRVRGP
jgi:hypothetical protein